MAAEGYDHLPEVFHCFGMTLLGDNSLSSEVLQAYKDSTSWDPEYFTFEPHVMCQVGTRQLHMNNKIFIWNLSRPKRKLGQVLSEALAWTWSEQFQNCTVIGLGAQDLVSGIYSYEEVNGNKEFWEELFIGITGKMVEYKHQTALRHGRLDTFNAWLSVHRFAVYPLPALPVSEIEACGKITAAQYNALRRKQGRRFKLSSVREKLDANKIYPLKPNINNPNFVDGRLESPFAEAYVKPIFDFVREHYCSQCKNPYIHNRTWQNHLLEEPLGEDHVLNNIPMDVWEHIFGYLSVFDIGVLRRACMAFYGLSHGLRVIRCKGPLNIAAENIKLRTPE